LPFKTVVVQRNKREAPALSGGLIAAMALRLQVDQLLGRALINWRPKCRLGCAV